MFIGNKQIKEVPIPDENGLMLVQYEDGTQETISKLMFDATLSPEACDATTLREKRINPVVAELLKVLRNWGIKLNELPYMSAVLNESLKTNENEALKELWLKWVPTLNSLDDIDLVTIDRVLRSKAPVEQIISPYGGKAE